MLTAIANTVGLGLKLEPAASTTESPADFKSVFQRLISGPVQVWQFAASAVPAGELNPNSIDMYQLDTAEVTMIMASVAPTSKTGSDLSG
ncbi:MAG: hypothetical protein ACKODR_00650, partial [Acidimicrobiaceae bacterium]